MEQDALQYHLLKVFSELQSRIAQRVVETLSEQSNAIGLPLVSEKLLKDVELCEALQISTAHFYKVKRKHKHFPVYDIDGAKRYKLSEVEQFIKSLKQ
jgi:predicted DNA-binding transcriptional regulator AlpA